MSNSLKEIVVAYFNGGNATSNGERMKSSAHIKEDLEAIREFCNDSQQDSI